MLMSNDRNVIVDFKAGEYVRKMFLSHSVTGRSKEKLRPSTYYFRSFITPFITTSVRS